MSISIRQALIQYAECQKNIDEINYAMALLDDSIENETMNCVETILILAKRDQENQIKKLDERLDRSILADELPQIQEEKAEEN